MMGKDGGQAHQGLTRLRGVGRLRVPPRHHGPAWAEGDKVIAAIHAQIWPESARSWRAYPVLARLSWVAGFCDGN